MSVLGAMVSASIGWMKRLGGGGSTLLQGLVSYWPLDEVSGTRSDVVGSNHLTDNNTVGAVLRGPEGTVANFVAASSESLSKDADVFAAQNDFSIAVWLDGDATQGGANTRPISRDSNGSWDYALLFNGGGSAWYVLNPTGGLVSVNGSNVGAGMHLFVCGLDTTQQKAWISVDGAAKAYSAAYTGTLALNAGKAFTLGSMSGGGYHYQGKMGPSGFWNSSIGDSAIATLFASGNGLRYAELSDDLKTGLVSWWELDEVSGVRYDSHGSNDLTDNNTVGCEYQGPLGVVASTVEANSEYLSSTSADFTPAGSFSASLWVYITSSDICFFMGKEFSDPQSEWSLLTGAAGELEGRFWGGGLTQAGPPAAGWAGRPNNWSAPNLNKWWLLTYVYDATAHTVTMYLNDAAGASASTGVRTLSELGGAFTLLGGARSAYDTNKAASAGFWTKALSGAEVTELFNNGAGLRYADLSDGLKTSLVSWWNLDEQSGVRYDSHGTNHLTDNNTVGSVINAGDAMDGAAASFVAANSEYLSTGSPVLSGTAMSLSFWAKPEGAADKTVITTGNLAVSAGWDVALDSGATVFFHMNTLGAEYAYWIFGSAPTDWTHYLLTFEDGTPYLYVNGALVPVSGTAGTTTSLPEGSRTWIGNAGTSYPRHFNGRLDEVAIWSRVLTADERAELFNLGRGKFYDFA